MPNNPETAKSHLLIDGEFSAEEAQMILMALIENKIQFHQQENLSQQERFGSTSRRSDRRIGQLLQTKADLTAVINDAKASDERLAVKCNIEITRLPR
ncbi:MAG: hypothetical protein HLUCCX14_15395 [Marinobacter excellens HL-55]|uniref:Uncharacterized protein n=1 Tax=Marinobacter excellens HL-55 TaxID=1305731 RepID=A0A0P7YAM6_9GAMM|nr:MAG: hypothetical protein HLUCCX14_15395 [Marinobacter excellens HL-55]